jgi:hypothetical protein
MSRHLERTTRQRMGAYSCRWRMSLLDAVPTFEALLYYAISNPSPIVGPIGAFEVFDLFARDVHDWHIECLRAISGAVFTVAGADSEEE